MSIETAEDTMLSAEDRKAQAEAAAWMVRLYGEDRTPELERGLKQWLTLHPRNARHFEEMTEVWSLGGETTAHGLPRMRSSRSTSVALTRRWAVAAILLMFVGVGLYSAYRGWDPSYSTQRGEQRIVRLGDGSRIILNSSTRLKVDLTGTQRRVRLERGEALFEVAKDASRPFTVMAGSREVTAIGTSFVVRHEADRTAVTLVEGKVRVSDESAPREAASSMLPREVAMLTPGERMTFVKEAAPKIDTPRIESVTAWRRGEVLLDQTSLSDAVAEMNRYDDRRLVIDDAELASLKVSGVYRSGDSAGFAHALADLHGFNVTEDSAEIHLRR